MQNTYFRSFVGWGVSTLLLWLINRHNNTGASNGATQEPSKYTNDNTNSIGSSIPVVIGRAMIKSPLISYYGDFDYRPYTEEYGMHSKLNARAILLPLIIGILLTVITPDLVVTPTGPGQTVTAGDKRRAIVMLIMSTLITILMWLFNKHMGRTTIQKGFKYYLGWQNIVCWTGPNIGIKSIWMNVYDDKVEESTEQGVWDNEKHIAYKFDNPQGIVAHIDNENMFGGVDEGGGFVGDIKVHFGTHSQGEDDWMKEQMTKSTSMPDELKGKTPVYPMYLSAVIPKSYIGKQSTIPEMWFEVINYPNRLGKLYLDCYDEKGNEKPDAKEKRKKLQEELDKKQTQMVIWINDIINNFQSFVDSAKDALDKETDGTKRVELEKNYNTLNELLPKIGLLLTYETSIYSTILSTVDENIYKPVSEMASETKKEIDKIKDTLKLFKELVDKSITEESRHSNTYIELEDVLNAIQQNAIFESKIGEDANPADIIYEILKNEYWGCDYPDDRIDIQSLYELGKTCFKESLGLSVSINSNSTVKEYLNKILKHINGVMYDNPKTGKLTFKLIRNDFDIEKIPKFTPSNCENMQFTRLDWTETTSAINVQFTDASYKYEQSTVIVQDMANVMITHNYSESQEDGTYYTVAESAKAYAQLLLTTAGYPLATLSFTTNRYAYDVAIGDAILVSWIPYGVDKQVFRVTDVDYGSLLSGGIKITAVEDVFSFDKSHYGRVTIPSWTNPNTPADEIVYYQYVELPYEIARDLNTWVYCLANKPSNVVRSYTIWRRKNDEILYASNQSSSFTTSCKLVHSVSEYYGIDTVGIEIQPMGETSTTQLDKLYDEMSDPNNEGLYGNRTGRNLIVVGEEIMSFDSIKKSENGTYILENVIRGIYDTIPHEHSVADTVFLCDNALLVSGNTYSCKEGQTCTEHLELLTKTETDEQQYDESKSKAVITRRRTEAPSIMNNLQILTKSTINSMEYEYLYEHSERISGDISFKFIPRNKFSNYDILAQNEDNPLTLTDMDKIYNYVQMERPLTKFINKYKAVENGQLSTEFTVKYADVCKNLGKYLAETTHFLVNIGTYDSDKDLYSYYSYQKQMDYVVPRLVGVVTNVADVQVLANAYAKDDYVEVPECACAPNFKFDYDIASLIFIGKQSSTGVLAQDNLRYDLSDECYRIVGKKKGANIAIIRKENIEDYYTILSNFTQLQNNYYIGFQYHGGNWESFTFSTT